MERREFKQGISAWTRAARRELTDKLAEYLKDKGEVVMSSPCIMIISDDEDSCEYASYSELKYYRDEIFVINENGDEDSIDLFSVDEILRIIANI